MLSKRIKLISSLIDKDDKVLDVGTDHALVLIDLIKSKKLVNADGSDISINVINSAKENVKKYNLEDNINLYVSDGLKNIDIIKYNTLIIAGIGYNTIKDILLSNDLDSINKMIIQTNNNHDQLRKFLISINYKIDNEYIIKDAMKNYIIFKVSKGKMFLSEDEELYGKYNKDYMWFYKENLDKLTKISENIVNNDESDIFLRIKVLEKYISKEKTED